MSTSYIWWCQKDIRRRQRPLYLRISGGAKKTLEEDRGRFTIRLKIPTVRKYRNPLSGALSGEEMEEFEEEEGRTHETETFLSFIK
jgi:hypothetical protein